MVREHMEAFAPIRFPTRLGGHVALDFTNTAEFRGSDEAKEFLHSYEHAVEWCARTGILSEADAVRLRETAAQHPSQAAQIFAGVLGLRETVYRLVRAVTRDERPQQDDMAALNDMLREARQHQRLAYSDEAFEWIWTETERDLRLVLWLLALSAADLLTSPQLERARQCPNCGWLFVDTSRNGKRRWCSMDFCGSKMKSRRQYQRRKATGVPPAKQSD